MNLAEIDAIRNHRSSSMNTVRARAAVERTSTKKPSIIEFFLPHFSNIIPTMGENINADTSNDLNKKIFIEKIEFTS